MRKRAGAIATGVATAIVWSAAFASPASAAAPRMLASADALTAVVLDGEPGDWVGGNRTWTWVGAAITVTDASTPSHLALSTPGGSIDLAAPSGQTLVPGTYEGATRWPFQAPEVPGLSVSNDGRGCNTLTGRFVVHESSFGPDGKPTVFAASLEQHCEGFPPALWGEVRIASTVGLAAAEIAPMGDLDLFFGYQVIGGPGLTKTYTMTSVGNADLVVDTVGIVTTGGAGGFSVSAQTCAGATLAPGQSCTIDVHFAPVDDWWSYAEVRVTDSGTRTARVIPVRGTGTVGPATNDLFANAITVPGVPYTYLATTDAATDDTGDPSCHGATHTVWFSFTPTASSAYQAGTGGSWFPTALCVYTGTPGSLTLIAGNDDDPAGGDAAKVVFPAVAGTTYHLMAGANAGSSGGRMTFSLLAGPADKTVSATGVGVSYATFYPYKDGYRDTVAIRGKLAEWATVSIAIYSSTDKLVRSYSLGSRTGAYSQAWNGRNAAGTLLSAGRYRVVQRLTDVLGNKLSSTSYTTLSMKRLYTASKSVTLYGDQYQYYGDPGNGYVSQSRSSYARGVRISSGSSWAAVLYTFSVPAAISYKSVTFKVLGRSPNGRKAWIAVWNPSLGSYLDLAAYDAARRAGPGYAWYGTTTDLSSHLHSGRARGLVYVQNESGTVAFDVAKVRLTMTYTVLK